MKEEFTGWETTRLSKHFILLDFMADRAVYTSGKRLPFNEIWNNENEHEGLASGLCNKLLEPLIENFGPISVADAFWPSAFKSGHAAPERYGPKHRWTGGEATVDIALYRLVNQCNIEDDNKLGNSLKNAVKNLLDINGYCGRIISYRRSEFLCVTFKEKNAKKCAKYDGKKKQNLRAHHVRVGRYFNLLDFCRSGRAVEEGKSLVPKGAENNSGRCYRPVPEETAARSFAAALDPLVHELGRVSVVRGMETEEFATDEHAERHRWNREDGPWRLVFVLPQGADPKEACNLLRSCPHVRDVQPSYHPSESWSLALVVDCARYEKYRGLRPNYAG